MQKTKHDVMSFNSCCQSCCGRGLSNLGLLAYKESNSNDVSFLLACIQGRKMPLFGEPEGDTSGEEDDGSPGSQSRSGSDEAADDTEDSDKSNLASEDDEDGESKGLTGFERKALKRDAAAARDRALANEEASAMLQTHVEEVCRPAGLGENLLLNWHCTVSSDTERQDAHI
jgi:hypothetical protein